MSGSRPMMLAVTTLLIASTLNGCATSSHSGTIRLEITDLPATLSGHVAVAGPNSYAKSLSRSATLSGVEPGTYTITASPVRGEGEAIFAVTPSLRVHLNPGAETTARVSYFTHIPDTDHVVTAAQLVPGQQITRDSTTIKVATRSPAAAGHVGDFLASAPSSQAPEGFLVRVVAIDTQPGETIVRTAPARLTEAVPQGEISVQIRLPAKPSKKKAMVIGGNNVGYQLAGSASDGYQADISPLAHFPGTPCSSLLGPTLPTFQLNSHLDFHAKWTVADGMTEFRAVAHVDQQLDIGFSAIAGKDVVLCEYSSPPLILGVVPEVVPVGPVPLVMVTEFGLRLHGEARLDGELTRSRASITTSVYGGGDWSQAKGISWPHGTSTVSKIEDTPSSLFNGHIEAGPEFYVKTKVYGAAGPEISLGLYWGVDGTSTTSILRPTTGSLAASMYYKVGASAALEVGALGVGISVEARDLMSVKKTIWESPHPKDEASPPVAPAIPSGGAASLARFAGSYFCSPGTDCPTQLVLNADGSGHFVWLNQGGGPQGSAVIRLTAVSGDTATGQVSASTGQSWIANGPLLLGLSPNGLTLSSVGGQLGQGGPVPFARG